ncbi:MAG: beta-hydroxyacyl-ACP dehydratase [Phycisphaerales bacterium]|nr:MAG: beta-hydroxyacyl-ACP dehydratase [Phycisphaerales bacterium]
MAPLLLFDLSHIDLTAEPLFDKEAIGQVNPQRFEMQQLDGILWYDKDKSLMLGYKDITEGEFWVRGHFPGRPIMPGVIMVEAAAQLMSFFVKHILGEKALVGFGGIDSVKFRATVEPGDRLHLLCQLTACKSRKYTFQVQGVVDMSLVFEAAVTGIRL